MTMDGNADVVVGWTDGSLEVREDREGGAGAIVVRDKFSSAVAGVLACDYRMNGASRLSCLLLTIFSFLAQLTWDLQAFFF